VKWLVELSEHTLNICRSIVSEYFEILGEYSYGSRLDLILGLPKKWDNLEDTLTNLYPKLTASNCNPLLSRDERGLVLYVFEGRESHNLAINIGLAITTLFTVFLSGLALSGARESLVGAQGLAWSPIAYVIGLLIPLIIHELGHWSFMRLYKTPSSLPYLIPAPPLQLGFLGTFGAVINLRWLPPSGNSLSLMALAGPLAGYIVAIPLAVYGVLSSVSVTTLPEGTLTLNIVPLSFIIIHGLAWRGEGYMLLSPLAFASYVVFFVTFLNLIPIAMLDGGHIVRGVAGSIAHSIISRLFILVLVAMAVFNPNFIFFALIAILLYFISGGKHPGPAMKVESSPNVSLIASILYGVLLVLTIPIPL